MIDWDGAYRNDDAPAWNIGEPQPEFAALIDQDGVVRGEVLDAGCGYAELALALAARGHTVHGIDLTPTAVAAATAAAAERGLRTATFEQADISAFTGHDGRFGTIFDSGLLHALPADLRDGYLQSARRAAAPGATFYILAFGAGAFGDHDGDRARRRVRGHRLLAQAGGDRRWLRGLHPRHRLHPGSGLHLPDRRDLQRGGC